MDKKIKLLVIDDEKIVLKSCLRIFKNQNYDIETADSGETGLEKIEKGHFDIVITDLKMPGIGGMDVVRNVKVNHPDVTIIIFTGFATVETAREALKLGVFDYIPKPFTPDELRDVCPILPISQINEDTLQILDMSDKERIGRAIDCCAICEKRLYNKEAVIQKLSELIKV